MKLRTNNQGFSLLELTITLVVGTILMLGMLPLIRMASQRGVEMQLQMRDVLELQSLAERLSAYAAGNTNLTVTKTALGSAGQKNNFSTVGDFYLHSSSYVYFDSSAEGDEFYLQLTNIASSAEDLEIGSDSMSGDKLSSPVSFSNSGLMSLFLFTNSVAS